MTSAERLAVMVVVGARPQFVKAAAILRAFEDVAVEEVALQTQHRLVHTGQHYDSNMSDVFFRELDLPSPDHELGVGSGSHGAQTGRMLERVEAVMREDAPDVVLVLGDTNSTLAGALAAAKLGIPVAHVEAGLRSYRRGMPAESNRVLTDLVSTLLLCPSDVAVANLRKEGIEEGVHEVGDVMFDVLSRFLPAPAERDRMLGALGLEQGGYALATIHRAENTDDRERLMSVLASLERVASLGLPVVCPAHPRTQRALADVRAPRGVRVIPPASYLEMLSLEASARAILTDSGGVQKEAFWLGVPCITLRDETEWTETVDLGWNIIAGCDPEAVATATARERPTGPRPPVYGDGRAAERIADALISWAADLPIEHPLGGQAVPTLKEATR
jgi:UDP-GlcNAc3NAcA epimerase